MYISLGGNCAIAYQLKKKGHYTRFPFDWCNISIYQLNLVLENDFLNFTNLTIKKKSKHHHLIHDDVLIEKSSSLILKNNYNITFAHEILEKYELETFQDKLQNRIIRFTTLENPTFIRLETKNISDKYFEIQYNKLISNLEKYFDDFNIIVISKNKPFKNNKITFVELKDFSSNWKYENVNWDFI